MPLLASDAIVLHAFDYLESSRIMRLLVRDGGVRSALARGARRSTRRFGTGLDLFVHGSAELHVKPGRDLDTLDAFTVIRARAALGEDLGRFSGASALVELVLRFGRDDTDLGLFDAVDLALDRIATAAPDGAAPASLAGAWCVLAALGFAPALDRCVECDTTVDEDEPSLFNHASGGLLCTRCAGSARGGRRLPPTARTALRQWLTTGDAPELSAAEVRAHQRLLREFVREHLADDRPLRAFDLWERTPWGEA